MIKKTLFCGVLMMASMVGYAQTEAQDDIALQMYTLRNVGDVDAQFAMARKAGFSQVELVGDHHLDLPTMQKMLKKYQLNVIASHVQLSDLESDREKIVAFNKGIGNSHLVVPWIEANERPTTKQGWIDYALRLDRMGQTLRKEGMSLSYHNHNFEMKKYDDMTALDLIMKYTHQNNLSLELDVAWVARGGQEPGSIITRYSGRIYAIHAKDNAAIGIRDDEMNFTPAGEGLLEWRSIISAGRSSGVEWYIVEHDAPKDPWAIITTSRHNLKEMLQQQP
ncbi:sugar phosphate isomerase/epimerase [Leclercia sp. H6W5]|uniref:sugar phosphate isomerase/epimerase family protein n=1 Tax=Leclercia tamurae TaxID=2926467 RepID=UPI0021D39BAC|nr:sugar phosphate isomerase/epimerase [Leclercia tamurae]MCU6684695.1 sugar phosphate isomerase/epimerase [Leclercia tamurae]